MIELLDWQDSTIKARIHGSSAIVPAVLSIAEYLNCSGRDIITSLITGYEISSRIGISVQPSHWRNGFQATGTVNTIGVSAAVSKLYKFNKKQMRNAIGIAGHILPISNGDGVFGGYNIKLIHGGQAAKTGIESALMAANGFKAGSIEGIPPRYHGFINITSSDPDKNALTKGLGKDWYVNDIWHKPYPVGLLMVGPVESIIKLCNINKIKSKDVRSIEIQIYSDAVYFVGNHFTNPKSSITDCQLSMPYCVAVALIDGKVGSEQFKSSRIIDKKIHTLAKKVHIYENQKFNKMYPEILEHHLIIHLKNGKSYSDSIDKVLGSPKRPMNTNDLKNKFITESQKIIGKNNAEAAADLILNINELKSINPIIKLLN